ncbi:PepSY domain-containing protein [Pelomonas sp. P7]|uniref:PepSY domain-containing protein n=1 Tax=Pelomonas caseinilytica TaxID=2906763 RepID=A0ABS8XDM4_9BURK|nr:PepSY domain-containing protein [Pelomonas sp. P7]MCE4537048.1 PepSY domain-containing protein [Pelomonas sp. P7]
MKYPHSLGHGVLALSLGMAALPGWAGDDCDAPVGRWQSRDAVRQMAAAKGWQIQWLKIDDGCYEIRATDAQGRPFKAKLDPETLKVLKMRRGGPERERTRERDHDEAARPDRPPPGGASAPTPPPTSHRSTD